ncbi:sulfurtransferase [Vaginella massiliensis]|uniref:sulfurtransferase n=1 Tax=Vaginella massiliensis TaxID=1816680 RepID=UPI0008388996|nr:sulfurtransferase [Vaginella massiliensis]
MTQSVLISAEQLYNLTQHNDLILLDATIDKVNATLKNEPLEVIPGSFFFDIEQRLSDHHSDLPHTIIDAKTFQNYARALGLDYDKTIVVYDRWGVYSSPRAWWTLKLFGFDKVYVLNGGLMSWKNAHYKVDTKHQQPKNNSQIEIKFAKQWLAKSKDVLEQIDNANSVTIDARSPGRFNGTSLEPRKGLRSGHIPNSYSLFFEDVLNQNQYQTAAELIKTFERISSQENELIFTCGSGVTACILALAAYVVGYRNIRVYDGSWSEWGKDESLPIAKS